MYFIETGLLLVAAPWTIWWRSNFFADAWPWLRTAMAARWGQAFSISTGVSAVWVGVSELRVLMRRWTERTSETSREISEP